MSDTDTFDPTLTLRDGDIGSLVAVLEARHARKVDAVTPAANLTVGEDAVLTVPGLDAEITVDGVTPTDGHLRISGPALGGIADRYEIPVKYLRRCAADKPALFADNVNTWMHDDARNVLLRTFTAGGPDEGGYLRAFLSDTYSTIDDLDVLMAALEGARDADTEIAVDRVNLTEKSMHVRFGAPSITALAPTLLAHYRRPWGHGRAPWETQGGRDHGWYAPADAPIVYAGFDLVNSEVGAAAWTITPVITVLACRNGLTMTADQFRRVHLGSRMEAGIVRFSERTLQINVDLVRSQTRDTIASFVNADYLTRKVAEVEEIVGGPITKGPEVTIETLGKRLRYSETERQSLLAHFIAGGQSTVAGIVNAVTSVAQEITDADRAAEFEGTWFDAARIAVEVNA